MKHDEYYTCDFCGKRIGTPRVEEEVFIARKRRGFSVWFARFYWRMMHGQAVPIYCDRRSRYATRELCQPCAAAYHWELSMFNERYLREHDMKNERAD